MAFNLNNDIIISNGFRTFNKNKKILDLNYKFSYYISIINKFIKQIFSSKLKIQQKFLHYKLSLSVIGYDLTLFSFEDCYIYKNICEYKYEFNLINNNLTLVSLSEFKDFEMQRIKINFIYNTFHLFDNYIKNKIKENKITGINQYIPVSNKILKYFDVNSMKKTFWTMFKFKNIYTICLYYSEIDQIRSYNNIPSITFECKRKSYVNKKINNKKFSFPYWRNN